MSTTWRATAADASRVAELLRDFNTEYGDIVPGHDELTERMGRLIAGDETSVMLVGAGDGDGATDSGTDSATDSASASDAVGIAVLRFRQAIWAAGLECYLAELYVAPAYRGTGLGRALLIAAIEHARARGAAWIDLGTGEDDVAARALYESLGFTNRDAVSGANQYFYERDL